MKNKRPITKREVEHFLWDCSDNDLLKVLLWAVGEVCVRFYKSKRSDFERIRKGVERNANGQML